VNWQALLAKTPTGLARVRQAYGDGSLPLLRLPERQDDLAAAAGVAARLAQYPLLLVLGTGGSSLGGQTLYALADAGFGNRLTGRPKLYLMDNVDPHSFAQLRRRCLWSRWPSWRFQSGGTAETLMQLLTLQQMTSLSAGQVAVVTEPAKTGRLLVVVITRCGHWPTVAAMRCWSMIRWSAGGLACCQSSGCCPP
jgi:glucose-6-phosphate isomerase